MIIRITQWLAFDFCLVYLYVWAAYIFSSGNLSTLSVALFELLLRMRFLST